LVSFIEGRQQIDEHLNKYSTEQEREKGN